MKRTYECELSYDRADLLHVLRQIAKDAEYVSTTVPCQCDDINADESNGIFHFWYTLSENLNVLIDRTIKYKDILIKLPQQYRVIYKDNYIGQDISDVDLYCRHYYRVENPQISCNPDGSLEYLYHIFIPIE